jgi:hypothetical protein
VFGLFGKRTTQKLNTVNLHGDGDDIDLLEDIEEVFRIRIEDHEAEQFVSVGQLYELAKSKSASNPDFDPIWELVCRIVRENSGSRDAIDSNTTFLAKFAEKRPD